MPSAGRKSSKRPALPLSDLGVNQQAFSQAFSIGELRENRTAFDRVRNVAEIGPGLVST